MIHQADNLCDMVDFLVNDGCRLSFDSEYVYLGSYFCDLYFLNTPSSIWERSFDKIRNSGKKAVLVIPVVSQNRLSLMKSLILDLYLNYRDVLAEFVVNDYAMLVWINRSIEGVPLWCGRMLSKEIRDPRYFYECQKATLYVRALEERIFGVEICGVEIDPVYPLSVETGSKCILAIHTPYSYISMGRICEFSSIGRKSIEKFRLDLNCHRQCANNWLFYEREEASFIKYGKGVYSKIRPNFEMSGNIRILKSGLSYKVS